MSNLTVGLTGGIASGKSLVATQFESLGVPVLDADQVSRDVVVPGAPALAEIAAHFGSQFIDASGQLDRRKMREHIFQDSAARQQLEAILHPRIRQQMKLWRDAQQTPYCILSVAILLETGMRSLVDRVLVVDTLVENQVTRLTQRDDITPELAHSMIAAQASRETRLSAADDVIHNASEIADTLRQVTDLHCFYLRISESGALKTPRPR